MRLKKIITVTVISILLVFGILAAVRGAADPGDRLYDFIFNRGFIQYIILGVFALATALLSVRLLGILRRSRGVDQLQAKSGKTFPVQAGELSDALDKVQKSLIQRGAGAALACAGEIVENWKVESARFYEALQALNFFLPALGLFGTMLGLSDALYAAFGGQIPTDEAVQMFIAGLSTALDSTVLGLLCVLLLGGPLWLVTRLEQRLIERQKRLVWEKFSLDEVAAQLAMPPASQGHSQGHDGELEVFRAELRSLMAVLTADVEAKFTALLAAAEASYRETLKQVVDEIFESRQKANEQWAEKFAERVSQKLSDAVNNIGAMLDAHQQKAYKMLAREISRLEKALRRRTPEEVIIRYQSNGQMDKRVEEDHV